MRYRVLDLPTKGVGAFTPVPITNPVASSQGLVRVGGAPGTMPIPAPAPTRIWTPPISADDKTQGSNVSPDVRLPDIYVAYADNMGPEMHVGMAARRMCPLPIPAVGYLRAPNPAMKGRKTGGRRTTSWPRAFQRYPGIGGQGQG